MRHDAGLDLDQALGAGKRQEEIARIEIEDAAEAANVVGALDLEAPEAEIGKIDIERRLGMTGKKTPPRSFRRDGLGAAEQRKPRALQRIGERAGLVDQD